LNIGITPFLLLLQKHQICYALAEVKELISLVEISAISLLIIPSLSVRAFAIIGKQEIKIVIAKTIDNLLKVFFMILFLSVT